LAPSSSANSSLVAPSVLGECIRETGPPGFVEKRTDAQRSLVNADQVGMSVL
jgi:hypothetical protein